MAREKSQERSLAAEERWGLERCAARAFGVGSAGTGAEGRGSSKRMCEGGGKGLVGHARGRTRTRTGR